MKGTAALVVAAVAGLTSSTAFAADLNVSEPAPMPGIVDVSNWDGPYVGVFAGYGWGDYEEDNGFRSNPTGWLLGVSLGADFAVSNGIVAGVVADAAWSEMGSDNGIYAFDIDWAGSLRGRLGLDAGALLPYLTAGLTVAGATGDLSVGVSDSNLHVGWTAGAGLEFAATESLSVDFLYRYSTTVRRRTMPALASTRVALPPIRSRSGSTGASDPPHGFDVLPRSRVGKFVL